MPRNSKKRGKAAKNARKSEAATRDEDEFKRHPHSFVFHRGTVGRNTLELIQDMRRVLEPYTASELKARKKNVLKDYVAIAGPMNVSHFLIFTKHESTMNLRIARLPRGPTLCFKIKSYCLNKDVFASIRRPFMDAKQFRHHPLMVMNGFSGDGQHLRLMSSTFQNLFPSINVNKVKLNDIRRCVLLNYDAETKTIEFRHYNVRTVPVGMSRGMKKIIKGKIPDLGSYADISEYLTKGGNFSDSEAEMDGPHNEVILPQNVSSRGNIVASKSAIRLTEIGPRLSLQLIKIQEGVCDGEVLYHEYIEKTDEELALQKEMRRKKLKLKEKRKRQQEDNVNKKNVAKEEHKKSSLKGMQAAADADDEDEDVEGPESKVQNEEDKEDIDYFREQVGQEPEPELFPSRKVSNKRTKSDESNHDKPKKVKYQLTKEEKEYQIRQNKYKNKKKKSLLKKKLRKNRPK